MNQDPGGEHLSHRDPSAAPIVAVGVACGLAWTAGLRGFMAELAGSGSTISWYGTFGQVLMPGAIVGALLGWAESIRRTGGRPGWRWLAAAPSAFTLAVFISPDVIRAVLNGQPILSGRIGGGATARSLCSAWPGDTHCPAAGRCGPDLSLASLRPFLSRLG
jgi:hypothetical protein